VPAKARLAPAAVKADRKKRLRHLIRLVVDTAKAKGWDTSLAGLDSKNFRYATVSVCRYPPDTNQRVTGVFEITCDDRVKIAHESTSFHSWGLTDLYDAIASDFYKIPWVRPTPPNVSKDATPDLVVLERLLRRFHRIARQLKHRYKNRTCLVIQDEYDVQDLLHAVLRGLFDDIRPEEYTPSYAGGSSRMDFLLKSEQIVIETKLASDKLRDKRVGEELIVDIKRYQMHPDCRRLICLVYDPHGNLKNPSGLEADLSRVHEKLVVKVIVVSPS
jgi:hypothetical protein